MKPEKLLAACFSPTGTTEKMAQAVAEGVKYPSQTIDLSTPQKTMELGPNTLLLAAAPVYGGRVPSVALERLAQLRGHGQYAIAVVVYGNREFEDALLELKNALEHGGFQVIAAAAFIPKSEFQPLNKLQKTTFSFEIQSIRPILMLFLSQ